MFFRLPLYHRALPGPAARLRLCAAMVGGALSSQALAQITPVPQEKIQVVEVRAAASDERQVAVVAKTVLRREEMVRHGDVNVLDALGRVPGLTVERSRRGAEILMRGLGNGYTQILVNGDAVPNGFSLETLSPNMVERIEVLRAPTADTGSQGIAGTINIILKSAGPRQRRHLKSALARENGGHTASVSGELSGQHDGATSYLLAPALSRELYARPATIDNYAFGSGGSETARSRTARTSDNRMDTLNVLGSVKRKLTDGDSLAYEATLTMRRIDGDNRDRSVTASGPYPEYSASNADYQIASTLFQNSLKWARRIGADGRFNLDAGLRLGRRSTDTVFDGLDENAQLVVRRDVSAHARDRDLTLNGKYTTPLGQGHVLAAGWQGSHSRRSESRLQDDTTPTGRTPFDLDESYDAEVDKLALFAQDEWTIGTRTNAYLGMRWEALQTRTEGVTLAPLRQRSGVFSPTFQGVWGLPGRPQEQVRLGLSRSYKPPKTTDLIPRRFLSTSNSPTNPDTQGNPELRPELAWGLDLAYERNMAGGGLFSVNAYQRRIDDVILEQLSRIDQRWVAVPVNAGPARVAGLGIEYKIGLRQFAPVLPPIDLRASAERNWSRVTRLAGPDNRLERQQPLSATIGADYKTSAVSAGASFKFVAARTARLSNTQTVYIGAGRTLDLYALWRLSPASQLRVAVNNALHRDTISSALYQAGQSRLQQDTRSKTYQAVRASLEFTL